MVGCLTVIHLICLYLIWFLYSVDLKTGNTMDWKINSVLWKPEQDQITLYPESTSTMELNSEDRGECSRFRIFRIITVIGQGLPLSLRLQTKNHVSISSDSSTRFCRLRSICTRQYRWVLHYLLLTCITHASERYMQPIKIHLTKACVL